MKRVGFLLKVKQEMLEEYTKHHEAVWPEMLDALRRTGWHNYSIFARPDGLLFGYFETPDSSRRRGGNEQGGDQRQVAGVHGALFREFSGAHADESMLELKEVFHLD